MVRSAESGLSGEFAEIVRALADGSTVGRWDDFLAETSDRRALQLWFGSDVSSSDRDARAELRRALAEDIGRIDGLLNEQLNQIIHHPKLQALEASWRGLSFLVAQMPGLPSVKLRVLNVRWQELADDARRAIEFDQTELFKKVYEQEFGMPGGHPFGVLLADFDVRHRMDKTHRVDDVDLLVSMAQTAAAAFAPLVIGAHAELFGTDDEEGLGRRMDLDRIFSQLEYLRWNRFRRSEDARFTAMTVPQVLMREPYLRCTARNDQFPFEEDVSGSSNAKYLWGTAVYALGSVVIREFAECGWFDRISGVQRDALSGGLVDGLPVQWQETDRAGTVSKIQTRVLLSDVKERDLSSSGFIPLCACNYTQYAAFYSCPSLHRPAKYDRSTATRNEQLSSQLNLLLCVARFAHYLKVIVRDRVGRFTSPEAVEDHLHRWIHRYVSADPNMSLDYRPKFPLREASIRVVEIPGQPANYACIAHLRPHIQGEHVAAQIELKTQLPSGVSQRLHAFANVV